MIRMKSAAVSPREQAPAAAWHRGRASSLVPFRPRSVVVAEPPNADERRIAW